ncbi:hypothetical protein PWY87_30755 [Kribbella solani]|uniref:hypothetical protein n=1 Tax=Kribbella solani TaxID=236067 RepID=UPI0029A4068C|nr:hypothetical protein [Kribbella solani]MDX3006096.1 hypothetical protein [Kribbella solani]
MEPLNLMVSLSHFATDNREHNHGLSEPAGRRSRRRKVRVARSIRRIWPGRAREVLMR